MALRGRWIQLKLEAKSSLEVEARSSLKVEPKGENLTLLARSLEAARKNQVSLDFWLSALASCFYLADLLSWQI